jgi:UDP-N-acetylmuramoyl-tripeptide--D-alanyl-D-alanine ligase
VENLQRNILWTTQDLEEALKSPAPHGIAAQGVSIDSRTLKPGDLFIALEGPLTNGHQYAAQALERGASAVLIHQDLQLKGPIIRVPNTFEALQTLGRFARHRTQAHVMAITGSFGKTTTKETLATLLSHQGPTTATKSSFNNLWGVPLTLAHVHPEDQFAVIEMGMNHSGELTPLSTLTQPDIALITTIGAAHYGNFRDLDQIADAKAEIFNGMCAGGKAILNAANPYYARLKNHAFHKNLSIISFGDKTSEFYVDHLTPLPLGYHIVARTPEGLLSYTLPFLAEHWILNSLGILAAVWALGASLSQAATTFETLRAIPGRGEITEIKLSQGSFQLIDESYNAAPASMTAALEVLSRLPQVSGRRIAVLSDMLELGSLSRQAHESLAPLLDESIDFTFLLGQEMGALREKLPPDRYRYYGDDLETLVKDVTAFVQPGDVIMAKGSRGQRAYRGKLSAVVDALKALGEASPGCP